MTLEEALVYVDTYADTRASTHYWVLSTHDWVLLQLAAEVRRQHAQIERLKDTIDNLRLQLEDADDAAMGEA
jgi:cell division protein FtsB